MTMNPFEQSTQQLLRFLTSHAEWEVIDYIRQEIQHDAPESVPTADELLRYQQLKELGIVHSAKEFIQLFHPDEQEDIP